MSTSAYDYIFPMKDLENDLLKLVPFNVTQSSLQIVFSFDLMVALQESLHCQGFVEKATPMVWTYIAWGPFETASEMAAQVQESRKDGMFFYAVYDKKLRQEPTLAGMIALLCSSATHLCTEIGYVLMLPEFHRTHVTTNAVGLMLHYCLDLPEKSGLGLRRTEWTTSANNQKSRNAAIRLGFKYESIARWSRVWPGVESKAIASNGIDMRAGDIRPGWTGRDTAIYAMCWDDWENGGREKIDEMMKPRM